MPISTQADSAPTDITADAANKQVLSQHAESRQLPLCVDLDGTLISSDLLWESLLQLIRSKPWYLFLVPLWILRGRAAFKAAIAAHIQLHPTSLPYNKALIEWLQQQRRLGRALWLCTAADESVATGIATHLEMFQGVLASDGRCNLSGQNKAARLTLEFGHRGFDYCGNEHVDLHVWKCANGAIVVGDTGALAKEAAKFSAVLQRFPPVVLRRQALWRALKARRWIKNLLVLLPLLALDAPGETPSVVNAILAAISFCLCASSGYIINDLLDLQADRAHAVNATRPFAAGDLSISTGVVVASLLLMASLSVAWFLPINTTLALIAYFTLAVAYSWILKSHVVLRELALATLNTLRLVTGAAAIDAPISTSTIALLIAIFMALSFAKKYFHSHTTPRNRA